VFIPLWRGQDISAGDQPDLQSIDHRFKPHCWVFFWYGPLASLSLQSAIVASEHHGKNNGGPNQWIRVEITPTFLKDLPSSLFFLIRVAEFWQVMCKLA